MCFKTILEFPSTCIAADIFENYFSMVKSTVVQPPLLARLATVSVLEAGGKPSTWFPPGGLVEPTTPPEFPVITLMGFQLGMSQCKLPEIFLLIEF